MSPMLSRIPVVGGLGYRERVATLPASFTATLAVEPDNRYFRHAIAVLVNGGKIGYIAPEIAGDYYEMIQGSTGQITCPARRASQMDHETSGVEVLLDFSSIPPPAVQ